VIAAAVALTCAPGLRGFGQATPDSSSALPVHDIQQIIGAQGTMSDGVLDISIDREDIKPVQGPVYRPVTFTPSFELNGDITFQSLAGGRAFMNGDLPLKEEETQRFIGALINNGLIVQAYHQHFPMHPQIWFIHFRGEGAPRALARAVRAAIDTTSTPLPQQMPSNPTSPLDAQRLGRILHGMASVGNDGVVTVSVNRADKITIDNIVVKPEANIYTQVEFKPLGGSTAAVVPDMAMKAGEVRRVVDLMFNHYDWAQGCLYNQETNETPQLYFDHMLKIGNAYELAEQIRQGLNLTASE
jgi:hypothetical protein